MKINMKIKRYGRLVAISTLIPAALLTQPEEARAMHISEGILPLPWALFWYLATLPFFAFGLKRLKEIAREELSVKPLLGLMAAVVFIISLLPVPVPTAGTCSHPCGTGISGIILGPFLSVVVAAAALFIQALLLAHGGLTTLGANVFALGVVGSLTGYLTFRGLRALRANLAFAGFAAGLLADWATYAATATQLALGLAGETPALSLFTKIVIAFLPTQLPLGLLEGAITAGMVVLLYKNRPDLLIKIKVLKPKEVSG